MCRLLMIDDNEIDQMIMDKLMEKYGLFHHKESRLDGETAINELEDNLTDETKLPDIIFLDLRMPKFSGFDFLAKFKKLYTRINKNIDVFVITSSIDPHDKLKSERYEFVKDVLIKPLNRVVLTNIYLKYKHPFSLN